MVPGVTVASAVAACTVPGVWVASVTVTVRVGLGVGVAFALVALWLGVAVALGEAEQQRRAKGCGSVAFHPAVRVKNLCRLHGDLSASLVPGSLTILKRRLCGGYASLQQAMYER